MTTPFNTPNTFAIYLMGLTFKWLIKEFGTLQDLLFVIRHS